MPNVKCLLVNTCDGVHMMGKYDNPDIYMANPGFLR